MNEIIGFGIMSFVLVSIYLFHCNVFLTISLLEYYEILKVSTTNFGFALLLNTISAVVFHDDLDKR